MSLARLPVLLGAWVVATPVAAQPHPWPFDFDPALAADPPRVRSMMDDLGQGLPQLPDDLRRRDLREVALWLFPAIDDALARAAASGPGFAPPRRPPHPALHSSRGLHVSERPAELRRVRL